MNEQQDVRDGTSGASIQEIQAALPAILDALGPEATSWDMLAKVREQFGDVEKDVVRAALLRHLNATVLP